MLADTSTTTMMIRRISWCFSIYFIPRLVLVRPSATIAAIFRPYIYSCRSDSTRVWRMPLQSKLHADQKEWAPTRASQPTSQPPTYLCVCDLSKSGTRERRAYLISARHCLFSSGWCHLRRRDACLQWWAAAPHEKSAKELSLIYIITAIA